MASLYRRIFPKERHPDFAQTEWASTWDDAFHGFGYAAQFLTEHRKRFGALVDHIGLPLFVLQRHRVELGLKLLLKHRKASVPGDHSLHVLWEECARAFQGKWADEWALFARSQKEFVYMMQGVDPSSQTFRYPDAKDGTAFERPRYINLAELESVATAFENDVSGLIDATSVEADAWE